MTLQSAIFFSIIGALPIAAGAVSGVVELRDSHEVAVRKQRDYSGVVISLKLVQPTIGERSVAGQATSGKVVMLQKNKAFAPHVVAIPVGWSVEFPNSDPIFHSAFSNYNGQLFDVGLYAPGSTRSVRFIRPGIVRVFCNIHSTMSAVIAVLDQPYFTVTRRDGSFEIPNVEVGEYILEAFHERATEATLRQVNRRLTVGEQPTTVPRVEISESGYLPIPHKNKYGQEYLPDSDDRVIYPGARK